MQKQILADIGRLQCPNMNLPFPAVAAAPVIYQCKKCQKALKLVLPPRAFSLVAACDTTNWEWGNEIGQGLFRPFAEKEKVG